jgi:hypothetical protein
MLGKISVLTLKFLRTSSKRLGASRCSKDDFKLLDSRERALAVFIHDSRPRKIGRLEYFVELEEEVEVLSLAVLCGLQEKVKQWARDKEERDRLERLARTSAYYHAAYHPYPLYFYHPYY